MIRIHRSIWLIVALVAAVMILWNVPGQRRLLPSDFPIGNHLVHGWPWTYLQRDSQEAYPEYVPTDYWKIWSRIDEFHLMPFIANVATIAGVCVLCGTVLEWRRRRQRFWQLRVTDLLVTTLLIAGVFAYGIALRQGHEADMKLSRSIVLSGGQHGDRGSFGENRYGEYEGCYFDYFGPTWLPTSVVQSHLFQYSRCVYVEADARDGLNEVSKFRHLKGLQLKGEVTNAELQKLADVRDLRYLDLYLAECAEPIAFPPFQRLEFLWLRNDFRGETLASCPNLRRLGLGGRDVDEETLLAIGRMRELRVLNLAHTEVTDDGLKYLVHLENLQELTLTGTRVTDTGMLCIASLKNLHYLWLDHCDVSDSSVPHLKRLSRLRYLDVDQTDFTQRGQTELKAVLPNCDTWGKPRQNALRQD